MVDSLVIVVRIKMYKNESSFFVVVVILFSNALNNRTSKETNLSLYGNDIHSACVEIGSASVQLYTRATLAMQPLTAIGLPSCERAHTCACNLHGRRITNANTQTVVGLMGTN